MWPYHFTFTNRIEAERFARSVRGQQYAEHGRTILTAPSNAYLTAEVLPSGRPGSPYAVEISFRRGADWTKSRSPKSKPGGSNHHEQQF